MYLCNGILFNKKSTTSTFSSMGESQNHVEGTQLEIKIEFKRLLLYKV